VDSVLRAPGPASGGSPPPGPSRSRGRPIRRARDRTQDGLRAPVASAVRSPRRLAARSHETSTTSRHGCFDSLEAHLHPKLVRLVHYELAVTYEGVMLRVEAREGSGVGNLLHKTARSHSRFSTTSRPRGQPGGGNGQPGLAAGAPPDRSDRPSDRRAAATWLVEQRGRQLGERDEEAGSSTVQVLIAMALSTAAFINAGRPPRRRTGAAACRARAPSPAPPSDPGRHR